MGKRKPSKGELTDKRIISMFSEEEWTEMLELMRQALNAGRDKPVEAYALQRRIINLYAKHKLGNRAEMVLGVLYKDLKGR